MALFVCFKCQTRFPYGNLPDSCFTLWSTRTEQGWLSDDARGIPLDFDTFNFLVPTPTLTRDISLIQPQMDMLSSVFAFSPCPTLVGGQEAVFRLFNLGIFSRVWLAALSVLKSNSHLGPVATHKCSNEKADLFGLCP